MTSVNPLCRRTVVRSRLSYALYAYHHLRFYVSLPHGTSPQVAPGPLFHCEASSEPSEGRLRPTSCSLKLVTYGSDQPYPCPYPYPYPCRRLSPTKRRFTFTLTSNRGGWDMRCSAGPESMRNRRRKASKICRGPGHTFLKQLLITRSEKEPGGEDGGPSSARAPHFSKVERAGVRLRSLAARRRSDASKCVRTLGKIDAVASSVGTRASVDVRNPRYEIRIPPAGRGTFSVSKLFHSI